MLQNIWSMQLFFLFPRFFEEQQTLPTRWVCKNDEVMHDLVGAHLVMLVTDWKSSILSLFGSVGLEGLRCIDFLGILSIEQIQKDHHRSHIQQEGIVLLQ